MSELSLDPHRLAEVERRVRTGAASLDSGRPLPVVSGLVPSVVQSIGALGDAERRLTRESVAAMDRLAARLSDVTSDVLAADRYR